jgi:DNA modification methylase
MIKLFQADIRDGIPEIVSGSIHTIISDPPYGEEYLPLWESLGKFAKRVLVPRGSLYAMSGQMFLPEVMHLLGQSLTYRWTIANFQSRRGGVYLCYGAHVIQYWKPILWYMNCDKKDRLTEYHGDVVYSDRVPGKHLHKWQQNIKVFNKLVHYYTHKGDVICDPFMGSGTTGLAVIGEGRSFIGSDVDPNCVKIASQQLKTIQFITQYFSSTKP